ncbi:hypothetical protein GGR58DRAFT_522751 [Xylaria digitata]|nr:hypothetical protein GGR58DRAFT_522751 [Xylaria digitata]
MALGWRWSSEPEKSWCANPRILPLSKRSEVGLSPLGLADWVEHLDGMLEKTGGCRGGSKYIGPRSIGADRQNGHQFRPHRQKRKAGPYGDDFIDSQDSVARSGIPVPHKPPAAVIAYNGGLDHLSGEIGTIHDDEGIDVPMGTELEAADNTLSNASIRSLRITHARSRTRSRTNHLPSRGAKTFVNLYDAIAHFLTAFSKQEQSPFKPSPSRPQDKASNRDRSPSNHKNATGIHSLDRQLTPDHFGMSGIVCTTSSDSTQTVADQSPSREKDEGDLQALLSSSSIAAAEGEEAVKYLLLSIGEKLSDYRKLNDYIRRGREAQGYLRSSDDASSISSEDTIASGAELARAFDQQLDELDRVLDGLIKMGIPDLLKKPIYRRRSRQRKNSVRGFVSMRNSLGRLRISQFDSPRIRLT